MKDFDNSTIKSETPRVETSGNDVLSEDEARTLLRDADLTLRSFDTHQVNMNDHDAHKFGKD